MTCSRLGFRRKCVFFHVIRENKIVAKISEFTVVTVYTSIANYVKRLETTCHLISWCFINSARDSAIRYNSIDQIMISYFFCLNCCKIKSKYVYYAVIVVFQKKSTNGKHADSSKSSFQFNIRAIQRFYVTGDYIKANQ